MPKLGHPPAFLLYPDDFSSDGKVEAMTTEQVGAYFLLLCKSWREKPPGSIPNDDAVLARWARLTPDRWAECKAGVLAAWTISSDKRWHQKRLRAEYGKLMVIRRERSNAAKSMHRKRLGANAQQVQCIPSSSAFPSSIPIQKKEAEEHTAAAFKILGHDKPFGHSRFRRAWREWYANYVESGSKEWLNQVMEEFITDCQQNKINIPPQFYEAKHDQEKIDKANWESRNRLVPL